MPLLSNDLFLAQLKALFDAQQARAAGKGSIYVTQKRAPLRGAPAGARPACLYRATDGRLKKFSTHVQSEEGPQFHARCMNILKVRSGAAGAARRGGGGGPFLGRARAAPLSLRPALTLSRKHLAATPPAVHERP